MKKLSILMILLVLLLQHTPVLAQETIVTRSFIIEQYKGKPYYLHFVKKGEAVVAIAKAYNVTVDELQLENPEMLKGLKTDEVLRIPQRPPSEIEKPKTESKPEIKVEPRVEQKTEIKTEIQKKPITPAIKQAIASVYIVKKKETLYGISKQFNVSVDDILLVNPQMQSLQEGMEINIPKSADETRPTEKLPLKPTVKTAQPTIINDMPGNYKEITVQKGQTAYSISKQYGITVDQFNSLNPDAVQGLKTDQVVRVPASKSEIETVKVKSTEGKSKEPIEQVKIKPVVEKKSFRASVTRDSCFSNSNIARTYEIALLLPLALEESDSIIAQGDNSAKSLRDYKAFDLFQFYTGVILAADSLEKEGFRAHINVFDADQEGDTAKIKRTLRKNDLSKMDLIIGPVFVSGFNVASRYALREKINIVNPLSRRDKIVDGNPFVYKTQPSDESIADGMSGFIAEKYPNANIIVIRNGNKELASLYEAFIKSVKRNDILSKIKVKEVNYSTEAFQGVTKALASDKRNIILMFTLSRSLVPNFASRLNSYVKTNEITLFGMPGWENIEMETDFLVNLDYHQFSSSFVNYESEPVKQFVKQFRSACGAEPLSDKQAFLGFDVGWYFFQALMNYGADFGPCLKYLDVNGLQYNFRFTANSARDGYQNSSYKIIRLQDYKWVEAR